MSHGLGAMQRQILACLETCSPMMTPYTLHEIPLIQALKTLWERAAFLDDQGAHYPPASVWPVRHVREALLWPEARWCDGRPHPKGHFPFYVPPSPMERPHTAHCIVDQSPAHCASFSRALHRLVAMGEVKRIHNPMRSSRAVRYVALATKAGVSVKPLSINT